MAAERAALSNDLARIMSLPADNVVAHPAADDFPGKPAVNPASRVTLSIAVDTSLPRWHGTGIYAEPGQLIVATFPAKAAGQRLKLRIGCHKDKLWKKDSWSRMPEITRVFPVTQPDTAAANAFGGLVYVEVPSGCALGRIDVVIAGGIRAPYFKSGSTDLIRWREEVRHHPAPWAELEGAYLTITLPSDKVRTLDNPDEVCRFWDQVQTANAWLAGRDEPGRERFVLDRQISAGYMHSGYPIMAHLDQASKVGNMEALKKGNWGFFHELGHNHQNRAWTFAGTGEVTCNLFSMYVFERVCRLDKAAHGAIKLESREKKMRKYFGGESTFDDWKSDPFLALIIYYQLAEAFGWEPFRQVFKEYRSLPARELPKTDSDQRDQFVMRMSRAVGRNLAPLFVAWKIPVGSRAIEMVSDLPEWLPEPDFPKRFQSAN